MGNLFFDEPGVKFNPNGTRFKVGDVIRWTGVNEIEQYRVTEVIRDDGRESYTILLIRAGPVYQHMVGQSYRGQALLMCELVPEAEVYRG